MLCSIPRNFTDEGGVGEREPGKEQNMKAEHLSTDRKPKNKEQKIDDQLRDSFPTSDPPSFNPGTVGAPKGSKSSASAATRKPGRSNHTSKPH